MKIIIKEGFKKTKNPSDLKVDRDAYEAFLFTEILNLDIEKETDKATLFKFNERAPDSALIGKTLGVPKSCYEVINEVFNLETKIN